MKPLPHRYKLGLSGTQKLYATATVSGLPELVCAPPADFDGPGDAWSPEHLLLASVSSCFLFTLRSVAAASNLPFTALVVSTEGAVDRQEGRTRFVAITLRAKLTVPAGTDRQRALRIMDKSEQACLISASLSTPVRLESELEFG